MTDAPVVIVGAGVAGLACARQLHRAGQSVQVLEASERPGGVVWTEERDGFLLDNGFHVVLTGFPESRRQLDLEGLHLQPFHPGAVLRTARGFERVSDPLRAPRDLVRTLRSSPVSLADGLPLLRLLLDVSRASPEELLTRPATTTAERLVERGFGPRLIESFFRPFFRGVFLERELATTSRLFEFIFRAFARAPIALPADGMRAVPQALLADLPPGTVRFGSPVVAVDEAGVRLEGGERLQAAAVVVATDEVAASRLLPEVKARPTNAVTTFYYATGRSPVGGPYLVLNGTDEGPVDHLCVPSDVAPGYAPPGRSLVSVNLVGRHEPPDEDLEAACRTQLEGWFGPGVRGWQGLGSVHLPAALPSQRPDETEPMTRPVTLGGGRFVCGGHRESATLGGTLRSGRRAATAVLRALSSP